MHSFLCPSFPAPLSSESSIWRKGFSAFGPRNVFVHVLTGNKEIRGHVGKKTTCHYVFAQCLRLQCMEHTAAFSLEGFLSSLCLPGSVPGARGSGWQGQEAGSVFLPTRSSLFTVIGDSLALCLPSPFGTRGRAVPPDAPSLPSWCASAGTCWFCDVRTLVF